MGVEEKHKRIRAELEHIETACEFVAEVARQAGMSDDAVYHCYLSVEEICTNIIEHGYEYSKSGEVIDIVCRIHPGLLQVIIIDDAAQFNPLGLGDPDPSAPLLEREGGGWGVFFVKKYMDSLGYRFHKGRNHFIMEKRRS